MAERGVEMPRRRALGDIAVPVAFALARRLRKAPRAIAQELAGALGAIAGIARVEAAPNGYLNFFLDRAYWLQQWLSFRLQAEAASPTGERPSEDSRGSGRHAAGAKTIVEHTAINP